MKYFWLILASIALLAVGVKTYRLYDFFSYGSETAQHYLEITKLRDGQPLLQGPLTSKAWLRLSSFPYYVFFPIWVVTQYHPLALSVLWTATSISLVVLAGVMVAHWWGRSTGLVAAWLVLLTAPLLAIDRSSGFFAFVIPLSLLLIHELQRAQTRWWLVAFLASLTMTLHASALLYVLAIVVIGICRWRFAQVKTIGDVSWGDRLNQVSAIGVAALLPQLPLLILDGSQGFPSLQNLLLWVPYKLLNFASGKTLGLGGAPVVDTTMESLIRFISGSVLPPNLSFPLAASIAVSILGLVLWRLCILTKQRQWFAAEWVIDVMLLIGLFGLAVHKNPPIHYFVPILMLLPILLARWFVEAWRLTKGAQWLRCALLSSLVLITLANVSYIFSEHYMFAQEPAYSYAQQTAVATAVAAAAHSVNQPYHLVRIGDFDTYQLEFKENYLYLLHWLQSPVTPDEQSAPVTIVVLEVPEREQELMTRYPTARVVSQVGATSVWLTIDSEYRKNPTARVGFTGSASE